MKKRRTQQLHLTTNNNCRQPPTNLNLPSLKTQSCVSKSRSSHKPTSTDEAKANTHTVKEERTLFSVIGSKFHQRTIEKRKYNGTLEILVPHKYGRKYKKNQWNVEERNGNFPLHTKQNSKNTT